MSTILNFFHYVVLLSSGVQGAKISIKDQLNEQTLLRLFSFAFADNVFDLCFGHILNIDHLSDILFALGFALLYLQIPHRKNAIKLLITIGNSLSLCLTIINGMERVLLFKNDYTLAVVSVVCSALWEEFVTAILAEEPIIKTMLSNQRYHITVSAETITYVLLIQNGVDRTSVQSIIVLSTSLFTMICNTFSIKGNANLRKITLHIKQ